MNVTSSNSDVAVLAISLALGLAVLALGWAGATLIARRDPAWRRVQAMSQGAAAQGRLTLLERLRQGATSLLTRLSAPARPSQGWQQSRLRRDLVQAGYRSPAAVNIFLGCKVLCLLCMPALTATLPLAGVLQGPWLPLALAGSAGLGFLLPSLVLDHLGTARRERLTRELPDVLDLMVISVEAGLGLDAAIKRVAEEVLISAPLLSAELNFVSLELGAGIPRAMALKNLASRCGVDEVTSLVSMLNQADRFGVSVGRSLRVHSDSVRTKRRQKMEEKAAKIPLKLLFPVLFMIFPAIMAVMAGPAIIRITESIIK
ncbi:MAG: type II secretion system F family protein [Desulfarculus sp.]|nr:type II secretion system F family protein [Desulfarculus sp.]